MQPGFRGAEACKEARQRSRHPQVGIPIHGVDVTGQGHKADISCATKNPFTNARKVLQSGSNLLNHLERKSRSFTAKLLMRLKCVLLPKLHTRVRFPSPAPIISMSYHVAMCSDPAKSRQVLRIAFFWLFPGLLSMRATKKALWKHGDSEFAAFGMSPRKQIKAGLRISAKAGLGSSNVRR